MDDVGVTTPSPIPSRIQRPRWTDPRVVLGVALVLLSVVLGVKVVASADSTEPVWAATHDLAAGTVLAADDVAVVRARLGGSSSTYLASDQHVAGQTLTRQIRRGELLPVASVAPSEQTTTVTVPLPDGAAPKLSRGQRVQLWLSTKSCPAVLVLADVVVQDVQAASAALGAAGGQHAVLKVPAVEAERVVLALGLSEAKLRATVLNATDPAPPPAGQAGGVTTETIDLTACDGTSR